MGRGFGDFDGFDRGQFQKMKNDFRRNYHGQRDEIRDGHRGADGYRNGFNGRGGDADSDNYTEEFHDRKVDYQRDVRTNDSDDDGRNGFRERGRASFGDDFRAEDDGFRNRFRGEPFGEF